VPARDLQLPKIDRPLEGCRAASPIRANDHELNAATPQKTLATVVHADVQKGIEIKSLLQ